MWGTLVFPRPPTSPNHFQHWRVLERVSPPSIASHDGLSFPTSTRLFWGARKKGFSLFSCGATPSRTVPKTQPLQVTFSLQERVDLRSQKVGILGKKIAWGRVGWTGQKKRKKGCAKKGGSKGGYRTLTGGYRKNAFADARQVQRCIRGTCSRFFYIFDLTGVETRHCDTCPNRFGWIHLGYVSMRDCVVFRSSSRVVPRSAVPSLQLFQKKP